MKTNETFFFHFTLHCIYFQDWDVVTFTLPVCIRSFLQWKPLNVIKVNVISHLLWSDCIWYTLPLVYFTKTSYCYHSVNMICFSRSQSDHINQIRILIFSFNSWNTFKVSPKTYITKQYYKTPLLDPWLWFQLLIALKLLQDQRFWYWLQLMQL